MALFILGKKIGNEIKEIRFNKNVINCQIYLATHCKNPVSKVLTEKQYFFISNQFFVINRCFEYLNVLNKRICNKENSKKIHMMYDLLKSLREELFALRDYDIAQTKNPFNNNIFLECLDKWIEKNNMTKFKCNFYGNKLAMDLILVLNECSNLLISCDYNKEKFFKCHFHEIHELRYFNKLKDDKKESYHLEDDEINTKEEIATFKFLSFSDIQKIKKFEKQLEISRRKHQTFNEKIILAEIKILNASNEEERIQAIKELEIAKKQKEFFNETRLKNF